MGIDYKKLEFELYGLLLGARETLSDLPDDNEFIVRLNGELERIKTKKYNVAVVGEFRRGKSSLINALLGLQVLPADATPTTATVNRITYGAEPAATIYFRDGSEKRLGEISELPEYVTKLNAEREAVAATVREAVIEYPIVICQNHVDIIDTPGLSDDEAMTAVTIGLLKDIDAAIVAVSALAPFAESEKKFVTQLIANRGVTNIIFVVTFIDQIDEDEYDRVIDGIRSRIRDMTLQEVEARHGGEDWIIEKAHRILDEPVLFGVSAKKALKAFAGNDRRLLAESRFPPFKEELYTILTSRQVVNMAEKAANLLRDAVLLEKKAYETRFSANNKELSELEPLPERIKNYSSVSEEYIDRLFTSGRAGFSRLSKADEGLQNQLTAYFIARLAAVRTPDNSLVRQVVITAANEALTTMNGICTDTAGRISELFGGYADSYAGSCDVKFTYIESPDVADLLRERFNLTERPAFRFTAPLLPDTPNLLDCNIIENIKAGISQALIDYEKSLALYLRLLRAAMFGFAREEAERLTQSLPELEKRISGLRQKIDADKTEHDRKNNELDKSAVKAEALLAELYEDIDK